MRVLKMMSIWGGNGDASCSIKGRVREKSAGISVRGCQ